jgi:hypothetical protein
MAVARIKEAQPDSAQRKPLSLIVVAADNEEPPVPIPDDLQVLRRPNILTGDPEPFVENLAAALRAIAETMGVGRQAEPARLLQVKEYRAAVISAMTLLEARFRERLNKEPWLDTRHPLSMRSLVRKAAERQLVPPARYEQLDRWVRLRNEVVHSPRHVSRAQATEIVNGVLEMIAAL